MDIMKIGIKKSIVLTNEQLRDQVSWRLLSIRRTLLQTWHLRLCSVLSICAYNLSGNLFIVHWWELFSFCFYDICTLSFPCQLFTRWYYKKMGNCSSYCYISLSQFVHIFLKLHPHWHEFCFREWFLINLERVFDKEIIHVTKLLNTKSFFFSLVLTTFTIDITFCAEPLLTKVLLIYIFDFSFFFL